MAVSVGNTTTSATSTATLVVDATCNLVLIFGYAASNTSTVASCSVGVTAGTLVSRTNEASGSNGADLEIWKVVNPATGSQTVTVTFSPSGNLFAAICMLGSDGTVGTAVTGSANSSTPSVTVTSATNNMVVDCVVHDLGAAITCASATQTPSGSPTFTAICTDSTGKLSGQAKAGAASVAMGWTIASGDLTWIQHGVDVHAAATSSSHVLACLGAGS